MALLAIPFLASAVGTALAALIGFFGKWLTKKFAVLAAVLTATVAFTAAFLGAIEGLLAGINYAMPSLGSWFTFLPSNLSACVGTILAAEVMRWVYDWNVRIIQWKLF